MCVISVNDMLFVFIIIFFFNLEKCLWQVGLSVVRYSLYGQYKGRDRDRRQGASSSRSLQRRESRKTLSVDARPFYMTGEGTSNEHLPSNVLQLGEALFPKVQNLRPVSNVFP